MNHAPLVSLHRTENKSRRSGANLPGSMLGHGAQLSFARGPIVIRIADNALAFWQVSPKRLIQNLLQRVEQFATLIQQQGIIRAIDGKQATLGRLSSRRVQIKMGVAEDGVSQLSRLRISFLHGLGSGDCTPTTPELANERMRSLERELAAKLSCGRRSRHVESDRLWSQGCR